MKKVTFSLPLWFFALIVLCNGCKKTGFNNPQPDVIFDAGIIVNASIAGTITDENGVSLAGVMVTDGNTFVITDEKGRFIITEGKLHKNAGFIKATKAGYFNGSRTFPASANTINNISIRLIKKSLSGTFDASSGGTITVAQGTTIVFPENALVNKLTNSTYSGTVNVYSYFLDPMAENNQELMPGSLRGISDSGTEQHLKSFGMLVTELYGSNNESLQLSSGKKATISSVIPESLIASAPQTIPLSYFDENVGMWKEEGTATKSGNKYIGDVAHFTWWNYWEPVPKFLLSARFVDKNNLPLPNLPVVFTFSLNRFYWCVVYTDINGYISLPLPSKEMCVMTVEKTICNATTINLYKKTIYQYNESGWVDLGTINLSLPLGTINPSPSYNMSFTGVAMNCNDEPVQRGIASLEYRNNKYYSEIDSNGVFNFSILNCLDYPAFINVLDADTKQQNATPIEVAINSSTTYLGKIKACGLSIEQYINFSIDNNYYQCDSIVYSQYLSNNLTELVSQENNVGGNVFYGNFTGNTIGAYPFNVDIYAGRRHFVSNSITVNITEYGSSLQFITGNFSGMVKDVTDGIGTNLSPISGTFRARLR